MNEPCTIAEWIKIGSVIAGRLNHSKGSGIKTQPAKRPSPPVKKTPASTAADPSPPTTETVSKRRRRLGLCLYCGQPGHMAATCPKKPKPAGRAPPNKSTAKPARRSAPPKSAQGTSKALAAEELNFPEDEENPTGIGLSTAVPETMVPPKDKTLLTDMCPKPLLLTNVYLPPTTTDHELTSQWNQFTNHTSTIEEEYLYTFCLMLGDFSGQR
uniref:Uncharacterized protein n=1 Tax=Sphaerodactylus townsendi TaxID=933632 RepID=A0ACB8FUJ3_9SAUR